VLVVHAYVGAKRESKSKPDLGIITTHFEVYNQNAEPVMTYRSSSLVLKRPPLGNKS
jgi:acyl dehydratase